nr:PQQ-binding-like beta-propeller repeat protein [Granulicella sp. dw_53]
MDVTCLKSALFLSVLWCGANISSSAQSLTTPAWPSAGQNLSNTRQQPNEATLNPFNVKGLKVKWVFTTGSSVSATPTVSHNAIYAPDWAGNLFAIRADTGKQIWSHQVSSYDGITGAMSRISPLVLDNEVVIGDSVIDRSATHPGASVIAVDPASGALKWVTKVEDHQAAVITGSPIAFNNIIYVGVSSNEEGLANVAGYPCCTFRGSLVALNAQTGALLWKTFIVPDNQGATDAYSGGSIWNPPAIDPTRGLIYIGTGNNYTVPASVKACEVAALQNNDHHSCTPDEDHIDSVMALDLKTGAIKWSTKLNTYDAFTLACRTMPPGVACPSPSGPDADLTAGGPNLVNNTVGFGQKNGMYWALNPDDGHIVWANLVGPGSVEGGIQWGTATDGDRIYVPISNFNNTSYLLQPSGPRINWGFWSGLDAKKGKILWQTADPDAGTFDTGAPSVANGVVYFGSMSGTMYALNAKTGAILWSFASGGSVIDAPSIVDGTVYWGSGFHSATILGNNNNKIYAFSLAN